MEQLTDLNVLTVSSTGSLVGRMPQHRDSTYSSMSEATDNRSLSIKSVTTEDSASTDVFTSSSGPAVLTMSLQYLANDENGSGKLVIHIKDVKDLPHRDYSGGLEPYLVLQVVRTSWPLHRRAGPPVHQLRTRTLRHSFNPLFDQKFIIDVKRSELKEMGDVLFGVSYLPTAQRLSLNGSTGRSVKRKKTAFKHATECPEFNETLTFDLSPNHLESAIFLVLLCSRTVTEDGDETLTPNKKIKDKCLGKVALGSHVAGKKQRDHWLSVIQNPRRVISIWHSLK
ncbi:hypothetical protein C0J52_10168 [Blattella germanica]|nr:hypothetical protein C0J52_10168 [Blattella germanica]